MPYSFDIVFIFHYIKLYLPEIYIQLKQVQS